MPLQAYKRWGDHLGWLHAGNGTTSARLKRSPRQGHTWADLLADYDRTEMTVIEP